MRFVLGLVAVLGVMFCIGVASKEPAPRSTGKVQQAHQQAVRTEQPTKSDDRGTESHPIFVEQVPAKDANTEANEAKKERERSVLEEQALTFWTKALAVTTALVFLAAIFQVALFAWQLGIMRNSQADAKTAAEAAKKSADSLVVSGRPWILMDKFSHDVPDTYEGVIATEHKVVCPMLTYRWINAGKSPAFLMETHGEFFILPKEEELPNEWTVEPTVLSHDEVMIAGAKRRYRHHFKNIQITPAIWNSLAWGKSFLMFRAYVKYRDVFGDIHETRFCAKFSDFPKHQDYYNNYGGREYNRIM